MAGTAFKCKCGVTISRQRDRTTHEKTRRHLLAIQQRKSTKSVIKERDACVHHWRIDSSSGPYSSGYCLRCGLQGQFANSVEHGSNWGGNKDTQKQRATKSYNNRPN